MRPWLVHLRIMETDHQESSIKPLSSQDINKTSKKISGGETKGRSRLPAARTYLTIWKAYTYHRDSSIQDPDHFVERSEPVGFLAIKSSCLQKRRGI